MQPSEFRIEIANGGIGSKVFVDGVEQNYLVDIELKHSAGHLPVLKLTQYMSGVVTGQGGIERVVLCPKCKSEQGPPGRFIETSTLQSTAKEFEPEFVITEATTTP